MIPRSPGEYRRAADSVPMLTPTARATARLTEARRSVLRNFGQRILAMGVPMIYERPRSPCITRLSQRPYWKASGRVRPISLRSSATESSVARGPSSARAGSPGTILSVRNTTTVTPKSVGTTAAMRRARKVDISLRSELAAEEPDEVLDTPVDDLASHLGGRQRGVPDEALRGLVPVPLRDEHARRRAGPLWKKPAGPVHPDKVRPQMQHHRGHALPGMPELPGSAAQQVRGERLDVPPEIDLNEAAVLRRPVLLQAEVLQARDIPQVGVEEEDRPGAPAEQAPHDRRAVRLQGLGRNAQGPGEAGQALRPADRHQRRNQTSGAPADLLADRRGRDPIRSLGQVGPVHLDRADRDQGAARAPQAILHVDPRRVADVHTITSARLGECAPRCTRGVPAAPSLTCGAAGDPRSRATYRPAYSC